MSIRAYCFASGHIKFGRTLPKGSLPIASGPAAELRDFIETKARHGYRTRKIEGRPTKIPGTDCLLVPGLPEAPDQFAALDKFREWRTWLKTIAPKSIKF